MKTKIELQQMFDTTEGRFYLLALPDGESPYQDATNHISGHLQVAQADDRLYYACGGVDSVGDAYTTEIGE